MKYALDTNIITYYLKGNEKIQVKVDKEAENENIVIPPFAYMEKRMDILLKDLVVLDTEQFISTLLRERFDYTTWSREHFAACDPDQFLKDAVEFDKNNPA